MTTIPPRHPLASRSSDFDFALPPELIAQHPAAERSALAPARRPRRAAGDRVFRDLPALLRAGDLLVFNDTRVIKARLFGAKASGGAVEALVERVLPDARGRWRTCARASRRRPAAAHPLRPTRFDAEVLGRGGADDSLFRLRFPADPLALLERHGHVPLPPYITHARRAPTTSAATRRCSPRGRARSPRRPRRCTSTTRCSTRCRARRRRAASRCTSAPAPSSRCAASDLAEHRMHSEWFEVGADAVAAIDADARRAAAASSRSARPRCARWNRRRCAAARRCEPRARGETDLFITPGFEFRVVDPLVTNFHLPKSTLLMLVSRLRRPRRTCWRSTGTRSTSATASSATATRCCSRAALSEAPSPAATIAACSSSNFSPPKAWRAAAA